MDYESSAARESASHPGVGFVLHRVSFGRRMELLRRIRDLAARAECLGAGPSPVDAMDAAMLAGEIDRLYVLWGLKEIRGLAIDGEPASAAALVERGPEDLFREILAAVKAECGLSGEERKN